MSCTIVTVIVEFMPAACSCSASAAVISGASLSRALARCLHRGVSGCVWACWCGWPTWEVSVVSEWAWVWNSLWPLQALLCSAAKAISLGKLQSSPAWFVAQSYRVCVLGKVPLRVSSSARSIITLMRTIVGAPQYMLTAQRPEPTKQAHVRTGRAQKFRAPPASP